MAMRFLPAGTRSIWLISPGTFPAGTTGVGKPPSGVAGGGPGVLLAVFTGVSVAGAGAVVSVAAAGAVVSVGTLVGGRAVAVAGRRVAVAGTAVSVAGSAVSVA